MPHRLVPNLLHPLPAPPPHRNRSDNEGSQLGGAQTERVAHLRPTPPQRGYPRSFRASQRNRPEHRERLAAHHDRPYDGRCRPRASDSSAEAAAFVTPAIISWRYAAPRAGVTNWERKTVNDALESGDTGGLSAFSARGNNTTVGSSVDGAANAAMDQRE